MDINAILEGTGNSVVWLLEQGFNLFMDLPQGAKGAILAVLLLSTAWNAIKPVRQALTFGLKGTGWSIGKALQILNFTFTNLSKAYLATSGFLGRTHNRLASLRKANKTDQNEVAQMVAKILEEKLPQAAKEAQETGTPIWQGIVNKLKERGY